MKKFSFFIIISFFLIADLLAQPTLQLSTGRLTLQDVSTVNLTVFYSQQLPVNGKRFVVIQFSAPLTEPQRKILITQGFALQNYLPPFSYTALLQGQPDKAALQQAGIAAISYLPATLKISPVLQHPERFSWLQGNNGLADVLIKLSDISIAEATQKLQAQHFSVVSYGLEQFQVLKVRVALNQVELLAANPFVAWVEAAHPTDKPLNSKSTNMTAANVAHAAVSSGGYGLYGAGVVAGVGDDGDPTYHVDLWDRIINRNPLPYSFHGTHTTGTVAGAGIYRYLSRGYAPQSRIVSQALSGIWLNAGTYVRDYGMMATNNSYGNITGDPDYEGVYDLYSYILDQQAFQYPELLNVFAVGNDGEIPVPPYPHYYGSVLSGYQSAKNIISVGNADRIMYASQYSSSGPVRDGRLKPEMMVIGEEIISPVGQGGGLATLGTGGYGSSWGTSMSSPAVTGGAMLLCEQYRRQFNGTNPKSGLLKTLLMNGSLDIGNPGIDFRHGYGMMNLQRSLDMLKNTHYSTGTISTGVVRNQTIAVPANTGQLKVMLYWHDPAAALYATKTLVNDLDLEIIDPSGNTVLPQKLDTTYANVANLSTTGADHANNSEQVVINTPVAGNYTIRVKGYAVNGSTSQEYFVAYDYPTQGLQLYVPFEGESYFPGELMVVHWSDFGTPNNTRKLEYSTDGGASWNLIADNIPATQLYWNWNIPSTISTLNARVRITENGTSFSNVSGKLILLGQVQHSFADVSQQCPGYCKIVWPTVPNATSYEVMMKIGPDMQPIATTTSTTYTVSSLNKDSLYWFCVRPIQNGTYGKRSDGQVYWPNTGSCGSGISDGDLMLDSILSPLTGRRFSASELTNNSTITVRIKNNDDVPVNEYDVKYSINGGTFSSQHFTTPIAAGATTVVTLTGANLAAVGTYRITAVVKNTQTDVTLKNDTMVSVIKQLENLPVSLSVPFIENFESADSGKYIFDTKGLNGLDRWDFVPLSGNGDSYGQLRTFINTGIANGNRAATVDVKKSVDNTNLGTSNLIGTFNLANYNAATDEVRLDFMYKQHGYFQQDAAVGKNRVYVKGTENSAPQMVYDLTANQPAIAGQWRRTESIEISDLLTAAGQSFSPTTQLNFAQTSTLGMGDDSHFGGLTFDDIRLYTVANDVQAIAIDSPATNNCSLGSVPVRIRVKNSMSYAISNIPVKLQVDGAGITSETISSIAPNTTIIYNFTALANLGATGTHTIKVWLDLAADNFKANDTITKVIVNQPVISSFPYLQDFESGEANYYTGGKNNSWALGTPAGFKIRSAASGSKAWKTGLNSGYNDEELSYLYTPCFNVSSLANPTLSFAMAYDIEYCRPDACDGAWIEYSLDGTTWNKLGSAGNGTNWYNNNSNQFWDSTKAHWHVATIGLPTGAQNLRLRFVMFSDLFTGKDGVAIDDIHIYNKQSDIFDNTNNSNLITQNISGNTPISFTDNNKILATILPNNNTLGSTGVKAYINSTGVINDGRQYFARRNITVQPTTTVTPSLVAVRMYFLDSEVDSLRKATGCTTCKAPKDYTFIGITKYDDTDDSKENGTMTDNQNGTYSYYNSAIVRKVPYDKGYYAEVNINTFSELWLSDGTPGNIILPIQWISFSAEKRNNNNVLLQWNMQNESNALQYEVEVLRPGSSGYQRLSILAAVNQQPVSRYQFVDSTSSKQGVYQYRIKRIDRNGQVSYSEVRIVMFSNKNLNVMVYPNPAINNVQVLLQGIINSNVQLTLFDATGKQLQQQRTIATGTTQKLQLNIATLPAGVYQLKIESGNDEEVVKVVKAN